MNGKQIENNKRQLYMKMITPLVLKLCALKVNVKLRII